MGCTGRRKEVSVAWRRLRRLIGIGCVDILDSATLAR